jgi:hypothetical protein
MRYFMNHILRASESKKCTRWDVCRRKRNEPHFFLWLLLLRGFGNFGTAELTDAAIHCGYRFDGPEVRISPERMVVLQLNDYTTFSSESVK